MVYKNCGKRAIFWKRSLTAKKLSIVVGKFSENEGQSLLRSNAKVIDMCNENAITLVRKETVSDKDPAESIKKLLKTLKSSGRKSVNVLDLLLEFRYPPKQIDRAMSLLEKEGVVKEDWLPW